MIKDVLGHGNENCMLPGTIEANNAKRTEKAGGLLFSAAEIKEFVELATECKLDPAPWSSINSPSSPTLNFPFQLLTPDS